MGLSGVAFVVILASLSSVCGELVSVRITSDTRDVDSQCSLPPRLLVSIENPNHRIASVIIGLVRREVIPTDHHAKIVKRDVQGVTRLHHHSILGDKVLNTQAYHNHSIGASFVLNCGLSTSEQAHYTMEGSLYLRGRKFRLSRAHPVADDSSSTSVHLGLQGVAVMYHMTLVWEHAISDAAGVRPPGYRKDVRTFKVESTFSKNKYDRYSSVGDPFGSSFTGRHRYRRNTQTYNIDILPVVDYSLYSSWFERYNDQTEAITRLTSYLTTILTAVDMRLQTLSLGGTKLQVRMISPVVSTEAATSPYTESIKLVTSTSAEVKISAPALLETFNTWVKEQTTLPKHDHAMLFTAYDMIPTNDPDAVTKNITKGLAYIATLCKENSISLVEDTAAYQSENVAAHELGHSLGSLHDGENNVCVSSDRYMMATGTFPQTTANTLHPWLFSSCSSEYIAAYFQQLEQDGSSVDSCLLDEQGSEVTSTLTLSAQTVCEEFQGDGAFPCRNYTEFSEICTNLFCRVPDTSTCLEALAPAGTCCGNGKMCVDGVCSNATEGDCPMDDECPLGDQPSLPLNGQTTTCGELSSSYCYIDSIREACCNSCRSHESTVPGCQYGDKELGCSADQCGTIFVTSGLSYDFVCCKTCDNTGCTDLASFTVSGVDYTCPRLIADRGNFICYNEQVHTQFCCQECERIRDKESEDCPYGDREDCTAITSASQCTTDVQSSCCQTCGTLLALVVTTPTPTEAPTTMQTTPEPETTQEPTDPPTTESTPTTQETEAPSTAAETTPSTESPTVASTANTDTNTPSTDTGTGIDTGTGSRFGYKPPGFEGCFLPPCTARGLFSFSSVSALVLACLCLAHLGRVGG